MATDGWKARSIFHFVLPCADADRSIEFYSLFGFEIIKDNRGVVWPDYVGENFNMKSAAQGNAVQLILPHDDELQTRVDLIEWLDPRWKNPYAGVPAEQNFPRVMALLTEKITPGAERMKNSLIQKHYNRKHGKDAYYGQT